MQQYAHYAAMLFTSSCMLKSEKSELFKCFVFPDPIGKYSQVSWKGNIRFLLLQEIEIRLKGFFFRAQIVKAFFSVQSQPDINTRYVFLIPRNSERLKSFKNVEEKISQSFAGSIFNLRFPFCLMLILH